MFNNIIKTQPNNDDPNVKQYMETLTDDEKKVFIIAQEHLQSSFNIVKSVGYQNSQSQT